MRRIFRITALLFFYGLFHQELVAQFERLETGAGNNTLFHGGRAIGGKSVFNIVFPAYMIKEAHKDGYDEYDIDKNTWIDLTFILKDHPNYPWSASEYLELTGRMKVPGISIVKRERAMSYEGTSFSLLSTAKSPCNTLATPCYSYTATFTTEDLSALVYMSSKIESHDYILKLMKNFNWAWNKQIFESKELGLKSMELPVGAYIADKLDNGSMVFGFKGGSK